MNIRPHPELAEYDGMHAKYMAYTAPQGRVSQGWPMRRCSPEMAVYDPADDDNARREDMTSLEAWLLMLAYIASAAFTTWALLKLADCLKALLS